MNQQHTFISVDYIINKIKSHTLMANMNPEDIIESALAVIELVGIPLLTVEDYCIKDIKEGLVRLPSDSLGLKSVYYTNTENKIEEERYSECGSIISDYMFTRMLSNTDDLANVKVLGASNKSYPSYSVNYNVLHLNRKRGQVLITFNKLAVNKRGIPIIPDNPSLLLAIENYIKKNYFSVLSDIGKLPNENSLHRAERDYSWYVGQTQSGLAGFKSDAEIESFLNYFRKLYQEDSNFYARNEFDNKMQLRKPL